MQTPTESAATDGAGLLASTRTALERRTQRWPGWLLIRRAAAARYLEERGFPTSRDEDWRFTPLRNVMRVPYAPPWDPHSLSSVSAPFAEVSAPRITLVNGVPRDVGEAGLFLTGLEVHALRDIVRTAPERVEPYLGKASIDHGFDALNLALFEGGIVVFARAGATSSLHVVRSSVPSQTPTLAVARVLVVAEEGSELTLIESSVAEGAAPILESAVTEVWAGPGAKVTHVRVQQGAPHAASIGTVSVRAQRDSRYASRALTFGGALSRLDLRVAFDGPGAECTLDGLYLARTGEVVAHRTVVDHASPHCSSNQRYKGILDGSGLAVFDGTVFVRSGASATEAHQQNRNLLLSGDAVVHAKPHLEIDTDDVKCSHGATVGRLDPAQLFYLRSRGVEVSVARSLLTYAFAREVVQDVADAALRDALEAAIAAFLPDGARARGLA